MTILLAGNGGLPLLTGFGGFLDCGTSVVSDNLEVATYVGSAQTGSGIQVTLFCTGIVPSNLTGTWNNGGGASHISGIVISGQWISLFASTPSIANTYQLIIGGSNGATVSTGSIVISNEIVDFAAGIYGPTSPVLGLNQSAMNDYGNIPVGSYFARGLIGPATATLTGPDADKFVLQQADVSGIPPQAGFVLLGNGFAAYNLPQLTFSVTVTITDGVSSYSMNVTIQNPTSPSIAISSNLVLDTETTLNFWGQVTAASMCLAFTTSGYTFTADSANLFSSPAGSNIIQIAAASLIPKNFGVHTVTVTPTGGTPMTVPLYIGHETPPVVAWLPNETLYTTTQPTDMFGSNPIGMIVAYSDSSQPTFPYSSNPTGLLNTFNSNGYNIPAGSTYLTGSPSAGRLTGTCEILAGSGLATSLVMSIPVVAGTLLPASKIVGTPVAGLTNFLTTANGLVPSGSPITVLTFSATGFVNPIDWSLAQIAVPTDPTCQIALATNLAPDQKPRYVISGSGTSGTVTAWNLSAQTDAIQVILTDGMGTTCVAPFNITAAWAPGPSISLGPGGTFTTANALLTAMWANPSAYAGALVTVLHGASGAGDWSHGFTGSSFGGWWPCPVHIKGDPTASSQVVLDFGFTAPGGSIQGGIMAAGGYDVIVENLEICHVSNSFGTGEPSSGAIYKVGNQSGNVTVNKCYLHDSDNGFVNGSGGNHIVITNCLIARCGNYYGQAHNVYCGEAASLTFTNNYSIDSWSGHELKTRAMVANISNNYLLEGLNGLASTPIDICQGGNVMVTNNVIMKSSDTGPQNNGDIINWNSETSLSKPAWPINNLAASGNVFLCMTAPGAKYLAHAFVNFLPGTLDPLRNLPLTTNIVNNGFFNLPASQWSLGAFGATAPTLGDGNVVLPTFPSGDPFFINPYTGKPPVNFPNPAMNTGVPGQNLPGIATAQGTYAMVLTCARGSPSGTAVTGGLLEAYDYSGSSLSSVTWSMPLVVSDNASFALVPNGSSVQVVTTAALPAGYYSICVQAVGSGSFGTLTLAEFLVIIVS